MTGVGCSVGSSYKKQCRNVRYWHKADIGFRDLLLRGIALNPIPLTAQPMALNLLTCRCSFADQIFADHQF